MLSEALSEVCLDLFGRVWICLDLLGFYVGTCLDLLGPIWICLDFMLGPVWTCLDLFGFYVGTCLDLLGPIWTCLDFMFGTVWTCLDLCWPVWTCVDVAKVSLNLYKLLSDFFGICNFFVGLGSVWTFLDSFGFYDETCLDLTSNFMFWTSNLFSDAPKIFGRPHPKKLDVRKTDIQIFLTSKLFFGRPKNLFGRPKKWTSNIFWRPFFSDIPKNVLDVPQKMLDVRKKMDIKSAFGYWTPHG